MMLLSNISTGQFIGILKNLPENYFHNELSLASILLETNGVFISFSDTEKVHKTFGIQKNDDYNRAQSEKITTQLNESIALNLSYTLGDQQISTLKSEVLRLISNSIVQLLENQIALAESKNQSNFILRKSFHDLKNPLTSISLHAELIKKIISEQDKVELMANKIIANTHKMIQNMNAILDLQKENS